MKGYAIKISLLELQKPVRRGRIFKAIKTHYLGSFSSETAKVAYQTLSSLLFQMNPLIGPKTLRSGRGRRSRS